MLAQIVFILALGASLGAELDWWQVGPVYQIYPASFADSNGDGIGDLNGIASHAKHFGNVGVEAVWMSPIFASPMDDNGYDISNFREINPMFGNMTDFENLVKSLHDEGIKIMLDLVPNHTSNQSQWFQDSVNKVNGKDDWYVWMPPKGMDGSTPLPPNNWQSLFGGSAWEYVESRGEFYLHQFGVFQPDLNYTNPDVLNEIKDVIRFWLGKGVDGFRVDAVPFIAETEYTSDEPPVNENCTPAGSYECLKHIFTMDQNWTYSVLEEFAAVLQEQNSSYSKNPKIQFVEAYTTLSNTMRYYANHSNPFNFLMITSVGLSTNATTLESLITQYLTALPEKSWPNWVIGNHDNPRVGTRMGADFIDAMNMLVLLLPGTPVTYNGEEIGMTDTFVRPDQYKDHNIPNRDPERTPMQWSTAENAGFSTNLTNPYLPVNPNYWQINVASESSMEPSHLSIYKELVAMNKELASDTTNSLPIVALNDWVLAFHRGKYVVVINMNNEIETLQLKSLNFSLGDSVTVKTTSLNAQNLKSLNSVSTSQNLTLFPRSGVVFSTSSAPIVFVALSSISFPLLPLIIGYLFR